MRSKLFSTKFSSSILSIVFLAILSILFMGDSLFFKQQPANMDGVVHITTIAIFHRALIDGDFPVRWTDSFANYGLPMGSFAQQFTSYLGAALTFLTQNVVVSYTLVLWIGTFLSLIFFYLFLRNYFSVVAALSGSVLFNFTNYRVLNAHIRGALPEFFSSVFVLLLVLGLISLVSKGRVSGFFITVIATWGLILTHPMNVVTSLILVVPFVAWLIWQKYQESGRAVAAKRGVVILAAVLLGAALSAYYLLPLVRDIRFFNYGSATNHFNANQELTLQNFIDPDWYYFDVASNNILSRGHVITIGLIETILILVGLLIVLLRTIKNKVLTPDLLSISLVTAILGIFLMTGFSSSLYEQIDLLSNIQFPWRMLSSVIFVAPIVLAYVVEKSKLRLLLLLIVVAVIWMRAPQLYGKNYTNFNQSYYYQTVDNLHSSNMNTIWTADVKSYPAAVNKVAIIEGDGIIEPQLVKNSSREFIVNALTPIRMIDRTFYFPGWKVFVDDVEVPIEFQDINYRGVITYKVPVGTHSVRLTFTNTKTVELANSISSVAWALFIVLLISVHKWSARVIYD